MINVSTDFKRALLNDQRDYIEKADITLSDGTVLNLSNADIWNGGFSIEDAVSSDSTFELGAAIINRATLVINNIYDDYSDYDFTRATVVMRVGLNINGTEEIIRKGTYTVDEASYNGSIITLSCLDNMSKFDLPYSNSVLVYPATLGQIVRNACSVCDVTLNTNSFPKMNYTVNERPDDENTTFREVIAWAAQIAGCFARCDRYGRLEIKWFDQNALEQQYSTLDGGIFDNGSPKYTSGDKADGGSFKPWSTGYPADANSFESQSEVHNIYSIYNQKLAVDDVIITGVRVSVKVKDNEGRESVKTYMRGTDGYVIGIEENDFITTATGQSVANDLGLQLIGLKFRKAELSHSSDPTFEAGDVAIFWDRKGNNYPYLVTFSSFKIGSPQTTKCSAENPVRNSAARFNAITKNYVALRQQIVNEKTDREQALADLAERISENNGLFTTIETAPGGGSIYYLHDKAELTDSKIVWKMNAEAWAVTTNYRGSSTVWNAGMTVDGDTVVRLLSAEGINADWITAGTIQSKDGSTKINLNTGSVTISGYVSKNDLKTSGSTVINGSNITTGSINADYITTGTLSANLIKSGTMSADRIYGGKLSLGGTSNKNGELEIFNSSNTRVGRWDYNGLYLGNIASSTSSPNTKIGVDGTITTSKLAASGGGTIGGFSIGTNNIRKTMTSLSDTTNNGIWLGTDGIALGKGNFKVTTAGVVTIKNGSLDIGSGAFKVTSAGVVTITKGSLKVTNSTSSNNYAYINNGHIYSYANGEHLDIYEATLSGYRGSTNAGLLDLSAQYSGGGNHVVLEAIRGKLHLKCSTFAIEDSQSGTSYTGATGDLRVADGYNYTMHFYRGILTGWN